MSNKRSIRVLCDYIDFLGMCVKANVPLSIVHEYLEQAVEAEDDDMLLGYGAQQRFDDFMLYLATLGVQS